MRYAKVVGVAIIVLALAFAVISCGRRRKGRDSGDSGSSNFAVREAITGAMENDRALDESALNILEMVKARQYTFEKGLNDFVDQAHRLLSLIATVTGPKKPADSNLAQAQQLTQEYLRNRVHQLEAGIESRSSQQMEAAYKNAKPDLDAQRNRIRDLVVAYDPGLKIYFP